MSEFEDKVKEVLANPKNQGEMANSDAVGTVGSPDCGDMLRMWLKFKEENGEKKIDAASFQSFGCQTAIAVASMATEMLKGKTVEEAKKLSSTELSANLGALPPMKIHCGQLVEGALKNALSTEASTNQDTPIASSSNHKTLVADINAPKKVKIIKLKK